VRRGKLMSHGPAIALAFVLGCQGLIDDGGAPIDPPSPTDLDPEVELDTPRRDPAGEAEFPPARRLRRLSAEQFHRSLQVATGQSWSDFERFAGALGRPDLFEVTEEGLETNVTFEKLVEDAARATCAEAVAADRAGAEEPAILRFADETSRDAASIDANLRYLMLRFHTVNVTDDADPRLTPWRDVLVWGAGDTPTDDQMAERWAAVCVGLVTHPDFLSY